MTPPHVLERARDSALREILGGSRWAVFDVACGELSVHYGSGELHMLRRHCQENINEGKPPLEDSEALLEFDDAGDFIREVRDLDTLITLEERVCPTCHRRWPSDGS